MLTSTFHLPSSTTSPSIPVTHPTTLTAEQITTLPAFKTWLNSLQRSLALQKTMQTHPFHTSPYTLRSIEVQSVDMFSHDRPCFLKLKATVCNDEGESLPGSVFMRGGSVAMLIIVTPERDGAKPSTNSSTSKSTSTNTSTWMADASQEEYVILTVQPRVPAGSLGFIELPAGMIDDSGSFAGAAAKEIREETGLDISDDQLVDMTRLAVRAHRAGSAAAGRDSEQEQHQDPQDHAQDEDAQSADDEPHLQEAVYPSPGGSDEFIPVFLARKTLPRQEIEALKGKLTGLREDGEKITLKIVRLRDVWKVAARDAKTLAALTLYHGLKGEGRI